MRANFGKQFVIGVAVVLGLLIVGGDVWTADDLKRLQLAAKSGNVADIKAFIKAGDDVNEATADGRTALHIAVRADQLSAVKTLLAHGAEVNAETKWKARPLHWAKSKKVAETLLDADPLAVNARTTHNATPLHYAAKHGNTDVVIVLLKAGASESVDVVAQGWGIPYEIAGNEAVKDLLAIAMVAAGSSHYPPGSRKSPMGRELAEEEGWLIDKGSYMKDEIGYTKYDGTMLSPSCNCSEWFDDGDVCCGDRGNADLACGRFMRHVCSEWETWFYKLD